MKTDKVLLLLLRRALWSEELPEGVLPSTLKEWTDLYNLAFRQGLHTVVWDALDKDSVPSILRMKWAQDVAKVEYGNSLMDAVVAAQRKAWQSKGISARLMKGQSLAALYPVPKHRLCGDVDWFFPTGGDWDKALEAASSIKGIVPEKDSDGDVHYSWQGVVIEHHHEFHHLSRPGAKRYFAEKVMPGDEHISNLLMLSTHILKHAMVMGVSYRQVADMAVAYASLKGQYDGDLYREHVSRLGLMRWSELLHTLLVDVLGLEESLLPFPIQRRMSTSSLEKILLRSRNLGALGEESSRRGRLLKAVLNYVRASLLFVRIAPGEFFSRGGSLAIGRLSR